MLEKVLEKSSEFSKIWIEKSKFSKESMKECYALLKHYGLSDEKIKTHAKLLGMNPKTINDNYKKLKGMGLSSSKICSRAGLLGRDPYSIEENYEELMELGLNDKTICSRVELLDKNFEGVRNSYDNLRKIGLNDRQIFSNASLLGRNPQTIIKNYNNLRKIGLADEKICSRAELLANDPQSISRNYSNLRRFLDKKAIITQAQLLSISKSTIESNVQYLSHLEIRSDDCKYAMMLGTSVQTKRKKILWLMREIFEYKSNAMEKTYGLIRKDSRLLIDSFSALEKKKENLKEKYCR